MDYKYKTVTDLRVNKTLGKLQDQIGNALFTAGPWKAADAEKIVRDEVDLLADALVASYLHVLKRANLLVEEKA